jgi:hypothetical protein
MEDVVPLRVSLMQERRGVQVIEEMVGRLLRRGFRSRGAFSLTLDAHAGLDVSPGM